MSKNRAIESAYDKAYKLESRARAFWKAGLTEQALEMEARAANLAWYAREAVIKNRAKSAQLEEM